MSLACSEAHGTSVVPCSTEGAAVVGPVPANVSMGASGKQLNVTAIHALHSSACEVTCEDYPAGAISILECSVPTGESLMPLLSSGTGTIELYVSYYAPLTSKEAVTLPFEGSSRSVTISLSPPSPPSPPAPPPPPPLPPPSSPPPEVTPPWFKVSTGSSAHSGSDTKVRFMPIKREPPAPYSFPDYQSTCNAAGFRVWRDESGTNTFPGGKDIFDNWSINLGGHDAMSNKFTNVVNGQAESGHSGGLLVTRSQMAAQLHDLGLSNGQHIMCMKAGHSGYTGSSEVGSCTTFQLQSSSVSSASFSNQNPTYDLAFCACMVGEDCPDFYT